MKVNKTQKGAAVAAGYRKDNSAKEAAAQKSQAHAPAYVQGIQSAYEDMQPVMRRYAIDDHGGGYQGL